MTLSELAVTLLLLGALGLVAGRFGLSAIPAYLLAGILLGPEEPRALSLVQPSEVTHFAAEIGLVFLLFFLGLEFSPGRLLRSGRHVLFGGVADIVVNGAIGVVLGLALFGPSLAAVAVAACIFVSSSAIAVKALADFRRLADDETDLVLAILLFEDVVIAVLLGFVAEGGGGFADSAGVGAVALAFVGGSIVAARFVGPWLGRLLARLELEFFLLAVFGFAIGMAAFAKEIGVSDAVGALMAGVILSESGVREEIEERFFAIRDVFAALFFFAFGLEIDLSAIDDFALVLTVGVVLAVAGKVAAGLAAGQLGGLSRRQGLNAGAALIPRGEFTIIIAGLAYTNATIDVGDREEIAAFAGLYVLLTASIGVIAMKESKRAGRALFPSRVG
jgi:monovalent cation:H+ antiporter-2, CPA2 family